jgi:hypothetical protein
VRNATVTKDSRAVVDMAHLISEEDMVTTDTVMDTVTMDMVTTDTVTEDLISDDEIDFSNVFRITKRTCIVNT